MKQKKDESLWEFVTRFNLETLEVDDVDDKVAVTAFMSGIRMHKFMFSLAKEPLKTMVNLMVRV